MWAYPCWLWFGSGLFWLFTYMSAFFIYMACTRKTAVIHINCLYYLSVCQYVCTCVECVLHRAVCLPLWLFIFLCWCCVWVHKCGFVMFLYGSKSVYVCGGMVESLRIIILNIKQLEVFQKPQESVNINTAFFYHLSYLLFLPVTPSTLTLSVCNLPSLVQTSALTLLSSQTSDLDYDRSGVQWELPSTLRMS